MFSPLSYGEGPGERYRGRGSFKNKVTLIE